MSLDDLFGEDEQRCWHAQAEGLSTSLYISLGGHQMRPVRSRPMVSPTGGRIMNKPSIKFYRCVDYVQLAVLSVAISTPLCYLDLSVR